MQVKLAKCMIQTVDKCLTVLSQDGYICDSRKYIGDLKGYAVVVCATQHL